MTKPTITLAQLKAAKACQEQVDLFKQKFGESTTITVAKAKRVARVFDWAWATEHLLDAPARAEYERATAPALAEYERVRASAWAEFERAVAPAWAEYGRVRASAWAEFERVRAAARTEYDRARAAARTEYDRARTSAWAEFERARAPAFAEAYIAMWKRKGDMTKLVFRPIVRYHRNGVHGEGFYCIVFDDHRQRIRANHLIAIVFETAGTVAVMDPAFPSVRWRGDNFEPELRAAIAAAPDSELFGSG